MMDSLPNSDGANGLKNSNTQGFLRRAGKNGKAFALRRKRWYKLDGAIFSKHNNEYSEASWHVNVQGSDIVQLGKAHFVLVLKVPEDGRASSDFEQNTLVLHAKTEEDGKSWVSSLKYASHRQLENHYIIGQLIGEGGFAQVRLGKCVLSGEPRAIKTMRKNDAHAKLFGTEIAIIKRVNHPNIVKTFDVYETSTHIHIVMEYLEGGMLYDAIEDGVRFSEEDTAQFMRELIDGILYLHNRGIVHRDIKPENVLCTSRIPPLHVKIADFGLSSISSLAGMKENQMLMSTMIGTPEFIAPEIANRQDYTEKVDMWALGMLCYNVICGNLPMDETRDIIPQIRDGISLTFPEPEWKTYSEYSRSFVKALLCTEPHKRLTPLACLVHPWLERVKFLESNQVGSHGRVSTALLQQAPYPEFRFERLGLSSSSPHPGAIRFENRADVKRWWKIAVLFVSAANRFDWLINSCRYDRAKTMALPKEATASEKLHSERTACEGVSSTRKSGNSMESSFHDLDVVNWGSETDDEPSLRLSSLTKTQQETQMPDKLLQAIEAKHASFQDSNLLKKSHTWSMLRNQGQPNNANEDVGPGSPRKQTLRKKVLSALSQETEKRLAPVRKLSRKIGRIGEDKKRNSVAPSSLLENQFDMDLKDLNVVSVDEDDIQGLDDLDDLEMSAPASWLGKKHKALIKKSEKKGPILSPVTPKQDRGNSSRLAATPIRGHPNSQ